MNLGWAGNYVSQSGYAQMGRLFVPRLARAGHDVKVVAIGSSSNLPADIDGIRVLPPGLDLLANDMIAEHARRNNFHAVISLVDVWALNAENWSQQPWFPLVPIDHHPVPPQVIDVLKSCMRPIAISRFGEAQLKGVGFDPFYVPLAYDPAIWYSGDKGEARQELGVPDDVFYVSFVGVNDSCPSRKGIPELLAAWSMFSARCPSARLRLHTSEFGNLAYGPHGGVSLPLLLKTFAINPTTISLVDQYRYRTGVPADELATLARASDVLVLPSRGEGFGLPLIEFQACGCPVAVTNGTTGPELCFGGWLIDGEPEWSSQSAMQIKPGIAAIADTLTAAYEARNDPRRNQMAIAGVQEYAIENVMSKYMLPTLDAMGVMILDWGADKALAKAREPEKIAA